MLSTYAARHRHMDRWQLFRSNPLHSTVGILTLPKISKKKKKQAINQVEKSGDRSFLAKRTRLRYNFYQILNIYQSA